MAIIPDESKIMTYKEPLYTCEKHGDIGNHTLVSTIPGYETRLCLRCWLDALKTLGVCTAVEKHDR